MRNFNTVVTLDNSKQLVRKMSRNSMLKENQHKNYKYNIQKHLHPPKRLLQSYSNQTIY